MLTYRTAQPADARLYFDWANDPDTRQQSFNSAPISLETHTAWFTRKLADPNALLLCFTNETGEPVGQVRFERTPSGRYAGRNYYWYIGRCYVIGVKDWPLSSLRRVAPFAVNTGMPLQFMPTSSLRIRHQYMPSSGLVSHCRAKAVNLGIPARPHQASIHRVCFTFNSQ